MSDSDLNKKSASMNIQIEAIVPKTPKVHGDTNQETRKATVQLNIVEVDENVKIEPFCARTSDSKSCRIVNWIGFLIVSLCLLIMAIGIFAFFSFSTILCCWLALEIHWTFTFYAILALAAYVKMLVAIPWRNFPNDLKNALTILKC